ncbi:MAG: hypothetical protein ACREMF_10935 [Gemmatimonadales bacterium]
MRRSSVSVVLVLLCVTAPASAQESTTVGGYGEVHFTNQTGPNTPAVVNVKRFIVYLAHTFTDRLTFRSELELEDTKIEGATPGGEVALEQAFLDYRVSDRLTLRSGLMLPPVGIINEIHEPPTFNGVARPAFDHDVLPTTWREIGVGVLGSIPGVDGLSYRTYLVNGLRAEGFSAAEGIRGGRQEGREASFANPSLTGRLEWVRPGLRIGASFWYGGTANADSVLGSGSFAAPITLLSADARYDLEGLALRVVVATIGVPDAAAINARYATSVGSRITGGYVEAAYDVLRRLTPSLTQRLNTFVRHERFDTHAGVPTGTPRDPTLARRITTFGLSYKPTSNAVFKGDYQLLRNTAGVGEGAVLSLGIGYQF